MKSEVKDGRLILDGHDLGPVEKFLPENPTRVLQPSVPDIFVEKSEFGLCLTQADHEMEIPWDRTIQILNAMADVKKNASRYSGPYIYSFGGQEYRQVLLVDDLGVDFVVVTDIGGFATAIREKVEEYNVNS